MQLFNHKEYACYQTDMEPQSFHGTGDIWASVFTGCLVLGKSSDFAMKTACEFVREAIHLILAEENHNNYGTNFEQALPYLIRCINERYKIQEKQFNALT